MQNLPSLIQSASSGDTKAFGEIVERFQDMAYGYAYSILRDFQSRKDAAQAAFVEAYLTLSQLEDVARFPGWFRRIVFCRCDRIVRKKQFPTVPLGETQAIASPAPSAHHLMAEREMQD